MRFEKDSWALAIILVGSQMVVMLIVLFLFQILFKAARESIVIGVGIILGSIASLVIRTKLTGASSRL
jgi:hypothetical protein